MTARKPKSEHKKDGRPTKMTFAILEKLEAGFSYAFTDEEACLYADIDPKTLYNYQKRNPLFVQRKQQLRLNPNLAAKQTVITSLKKNSNDAKWWLEKKDKEFSIKQTVEHTGNVGVDSVPITPKMQEALNMYNEAKKEQIINEIKSME